MKNLLVNIIHSINNENQLCISIFSVKAHSVEDQ